MTATITENVDATVAQIDELVEAGCEIVRIAVPDKAAADALPEIVAGRRCRSSPTSTSTTAGRSPRSAAASTACASTPATSATPRR